MSTNGEWDRTLKRALPGTLGPSTAACLDAETLAAWSDGALSGDAALRAETHLSSCARCQSMLAVLVESEPAAAAAIPFWQRWQVRWLVPAVAGAAALLVWSVVPSRESGTTAITSMARVEPQEVPAAPPPPTAPAAGMAAEPAPRPTLASPKESAQAFRDRAAAPADLQKKVETADGQAAEERQRADDPQRRATSQLSAGPPPPAASAPMPPMPGPPPAPMGNQAGNATAPPARLEKAAPDQAPLRPQGVAESVTIQQAREIVIEVTPVAASLDRLAELSDTASTRAVAGGRAGPAGRGGASASAPAPASAPPFPGRPRWRILDGTRVERWLPNTSAWEPVTISPPVALVGGFAPSASVCWLIGPGGLVLRSTDGARFERVPFPEAVSLASIQAESAQRATVTTADGREFTTANGVGWTRTR